MICGSFQDLGLDFRIGGSGQAQKFRIQAWEFRIIQALEFRIRYSSSVLGYSSSVLGTLVQYQVTLVQYQVLCFSIRLLQFSIRLLQFSIRLLQFSIRLLQFSIRLLEISIRLLQLSIRYSSYTCSYPYGEIPGSRQFSDRSVRPTYSRNWFRPQLKPKIFAEQKFPFTLSIPPSYGMRSLRLAKLFERWVWISPAGAKKNTRTISLAGCSRISLGEVARSLFLASPELENFHRKGRRQVL